MYAGCNGRQVQYIHTCVHSFQLVNPCAATLVKLMQAFRYGRRKNLRGFYWPQKLNVRCHTQTLLGFNEEDDQNVATCFTVFMSMHGLSTERQRQADFFFFFSLIYVPRWTGTSNKLQITNRINTLPSDVHIQWRMSSTELFKRHSSTMRIDKG